MSSIPHLATDCKRRHTHSCASYVMDPTGIVMLHFSSWQVKGFDSVDIVEKEAKRLEVIKRRQEREFKQMLHFEMMRKELQVHPASIALRFPPLFLKTRERG